MPRTLANASRVFGRVAAISNKLSSRIRCWRGTFNRCASRSRRAAIARKTPNVRRFPPRTRKRSH